MAGKITGAANRKTAELFLQSQTEERTYPEMSIKLRNVGQEKRKTKKNQRFFYRKKCNKKFL